MGKQSLENHLFQSLYKIDDNWIKLKIIILCSIDLGNVNAGSTPLKESRHRSVWSLQITITLIMSVPCIFFLQFGVEKLLAWAVND